MQDLGLVGSGSATTAGTTLAVTNTTGAVIPAGTLLVLAGVWDNTTSTTAPTITASASGGGTWTARAAPTGQGVTTTAGSGIWVAVWTVRTTTDIAAGATITTLTSNQSAVKRVAAIRGLRDVENTLRGTAGGGGSTTGTPSAATSGTALVAGDVVVGVIGTENGVIPTADSDTLNGAWSGIVGQVATAGVSAANLAVGIQVKEVTATGAQTYNPVGANDSRAYVTSLIPTLGPKVASVGTTVAYATAANIAVPVPAGVAAGDLIAVPLYVESDTPVTPPDGTWTQTALAENDTSGLEHRVYLFTKTATGADSGTYTFTHASAPRSGYALRITDAAGFETPATTVRAGGSSTHTGLTVTTSVADELLLYVAASFQQASTWTPPAGFAEHAEVSALEAASKWQPAAGSSGAVTGTSSTTSALSAILVAVTPTGTSTATDLVVANATHAHAADTADLTQDHSLAVEDASHAHAAEAAGVSLVSTLAPADAAHAPTAQAVTLTQAHNLAVASATHAHTADNAGISQEHQLAPANATHAHTADGPALTQAHNLTVAPAAHALASDAAGLTSSTDLSVASATHAQAATDAGALGQVHNLTVAGASHAQAAEVAGITSSSTLSVASATHAPSSDQVVLTQAHQLAAQDAVHAQAAEEAGVTSAGSIAPAAAAHALTSDTPLLTQLHNLTVADATHALASTAAGISQEHQLSVADAAHDLASSEPLLTQLHELEVAGAEHALTSDELGVLEQLPPIPLTHLTVRGASLPDLDVRRTRVNALGITMTGPTRARTAGASVGRVRLDTARLDQ